MPFRFALPVMVGLLCSLGLPARAASAVEDCDQMTVDDRGVDEPDAVEVVVPCAMVDSGVLGADCHDAAFYVVNHQGTLLCRVEVALLGATTPSSSVDDAPPAHPSQPSSALAPAVVVTVDVQLLAPRVDAIPRAVGPPGVDAGVDVRSSRPRPS